MKNWRTTLLGVFTIIGGILKAGMELLNGETVDFVTLGTAVTAGVGLIMAKDAGVTGVGR